MQVIVGFVFVHTRKKDVVFLVLIMAFVEKLCSSYHVIPFLSALQNELRPKLWFISDSSSKRVLPLSCGRSFSSTFTFFRNVTGMYEFLSL